MGQIETVIKVLAHWKELTEERERERESRRRRWEKVDGENITMRGRRT